MSGSVNVVLFDVGGVLVEMSGVPQMLSWMDGRVTPEELWKMWLSSPIVRAFERGLTDPDSFADEVIVEMDLPVSREEFLIEFTQWAAGLLPGALDMVQRVPNTYIKATLCNTNAIHWPRMRDELGLGPVFDYHFASHLVGKIKPDEEAFNHVIDVLGYEPSAVLFIDDNRINVEAARSIGINAVIAKGVEEAEQALLEAGVLKVQG